MFTWLLGPALGVGNPWALTSLLGDSVAPPLDFFLGANGVKRYCSNWGNMIFASSQRRTLLSNWRRGFGLAVWLVCKSTRECWFTYANPNCHALTCRAQWFAMSNTWIAQVGDYYDGSSNLKNKKKLHQIIMSFLRQRILIEIPVPGWLFASEESKSVYMRATQVRQNKKRSRTLKTKCTQQDQGEGFNKKILDRGV